MRELAPAYGITRVTDVTRLDIIGYPVYASVRPAAASLCVNAGKGLVALEAEVGAYMEALEYAVAELTELGSHITCMRAEEIEDQLPDGLQLFDFCPIFGRSVAASDSIGCVQSEDYWSHDTVWIPAELVFHPCPVLPGVSLYGSSTNGLASGNSLVEATLHAVLELLERDVMSFSRFSNELQALNHVSLPESAAAIVDRCRQVGLEVAIRYQGNIFGFPYFEAYIIDSDFSFPNITSGRGLHLYKEIALNRAVTEAVQSRLSHIHGGRDDIAHRLHGFPGIDSLEWHSAVGRLREELLDDRVSTVHFDDIQELDPSQYTLDDLLFYTMKRVRDKGFPHIFIYNFNPDSPLAIVKAVIPGLEHLDVKSKRIGPRLLSRITTK